MQFEVRLHFLTWTKKKKQHIGMVWIFLDLKLSMCPNDMHTFWLLITLRNMLKDLVSQLQGKQQLCINLLYESLVVQCKNTTQPNGSFWCHVINIKGAVLLLIFMNKFVLVLYLSFSFRYISDSIKAAAEPQG